MGLPRDAVTIPAGMVAGGLAGAYEDSLLQEQMGTQGGLAHSGAVTNAVLGGSLGARKIRNWLAAKDYHPDSADRVPTAIQRSSKLILPKLLAAPALHTAGGLMSSVGNVQETTKNLATGTQRMSDTAGKLDSAATELPGLTANLRGAAEGVNSASREAGPLLRNLGEVGPTIERTVEPLGRLATHANDAVEGVKGWFGDAAQGNLRPSHYAAGAAAGVGAAALLYALLKNPKRRTVKFQVDADGDPRT